MAVAAATMAVVVVVTMAAATVVVVAVEAVAAATMAAAAMAATATTMGAALERWGDNGERAGRRSALRIFGFAGVSLLCKFFYGHIVLGQPNFASRLSIVSST